MRANVCTEFHVRTNESHDRILVECILQRCAQLIAVCVCVRVWNVFECTSTIAVVCDHDGGKTKEKNPKTNNKLEPKRRYKRYEINAYDFYYEH